MKMLPTLAALLLCTQAHAGLWGLTMHSRANCINNESISWDATKKWDLETWSYHDSEQSSDNDHRVVALRELTHRSAPVCWAEGFHPPRLGKWFVVGLHFRYTPKGENILMQQEVIKDCDIYDGWWGGGDEPDHDPGKNIVIGKSYADVLINFQNYARNMASINSETALKSNPEAIMTAFQYKTPAFINPENVLGYAPIGGYTKDKGWTGIKEFFSIPGIGNCSLSQFNMKISGGELKDSNIFPYSTGVTGDYNNGFLYTVEWYTKDSWMILECASKENSPELLVSVVHQAENIRME